MATHPWHHNGIWQSQVIVTPLIIFSDFILPITPMIPDTITCSGQGKTHDECAVLGEGFATHVFVGMYGYRM
jgi:hypothetical protein